MASQLITLGVGTPAGIPEFLLLGLSPGVAVEPPVEEPTSKRRGARIQFVLRLRISDRPADIGAVEFAARVRLSLRGRPIDPLVAAWGTPAVVGSADVQIAQRPIRLLSLNPAWGTKPGEADAGVQTRVMLTAESGRQLRQERNRAVAENVRLAALLESLVDRDG